MASLKGKMSTAPRPASVPAYAREVDSVVLRPGDNVVVDMTPDGERFLLCITEIDGDLISGCVENSLGKTDVYRQTFADIAYAQRRGRMVPH
jgi:hypothetical protein